MLTLSCLVFLCSLLHYSCSLLTEGERSSVDRYKESASVSHATSTGLCPAKRFWEFLLRVGDKKGKM